MARPGGDSRRGGREFRRDKHFDHQRARPQRQHYQPREGPRERRRAEPQPQGDRCTPTCPLFVCTKRALMIKLENGVPVAYCMWVNDKCLGPSCQYASCKLHSQLPDGRCAQALRRAAASSKEPSFEEELEAGPRVSTSVRSLISRRGLGKDLENELF